MAHHPSGSLDNTMTPLELKESLEGEMSDLQRGKMLLVLDLNDPPVPSDYGKAQANVHRQFQPQTSKDFEVIDDDVAIISSRAKNNPSRNLEVRDAVDAGTEVNNNLTGASTSYPLHRHKRRRLVRNQAVLNWESYMNSEESPKVQTKNEPTLPASEAVAPSFNCPICIGPMSEETSTKCGHIFCKKCIEAAIKVQRKCPTCRHKLRMKDIIRIYLPTSI
ncbi:Cdk-activating kinase assembly factor [Trema orientale]|uniref:Cdk-activating kinase assembly factor n=1 Tax=Trema orientale TaxID=63057 RepID=A0A2P5C887_TREOI|nr:Cdk-activating kinase assembly factor [Trema orientale]